MKLQPEALKQFVSRVFANIGCGGDEADCIGDHLVEANLAGHDSHGVIRTPIYVEWLNAGKVVANQNLDITIDSPTLTVADGNLGFGQWIGKQITAIGIDKCKEQGMSIVALRNAGHLGRIGHYAEMAAVEGLVSLHFVNTSGLGMFVVPSGGLDARLSVNPIAVGFPLPGRSPFILDMAAASAAEGKLKVARNKGVPVPAGWILDSKGQPTTDPNDFYTDPMGAILPFGGHKGYGLGLVAEILAGALTGAGCSQPGKTQLEQGMLSIYVDPQKLQSGDAFAAEIGRYIDFVKTSRPSTPDGKVLIPGDIEEQTRAVRRQGLELDKATWKQLTDAAQACDVPQELIDAAVMSNDD
ncbi:MAG: malate/lactate/ureidoglycolate dehydrogenase [Planctomycetaceae bacterium]|jgi:hydroxycarboxylate dehydrogenase B|nr:malate/lactate/ureidoglycolate dehydrogenase [Planctomycetaceae bacterium]MBT6486260.1 malate/lactate/ureidoglycolate dehydrogenase [Planctomycetaceae bacterium]MBT6493164.1 malate/lactate/ureidoglycolate dehydrogenase [Planctomycetaceae bacterium]